LLQRPIGEVLRELAIGSAVERALLDQKGPLAHLLALSIALERGDWATVSATARLVGIEEAVASDLNAQARYWADELQLTSGGKAY
jgi:c-di-GMP-related signal transduction protein